MQNKEVIIGKMSGKGNVTIPKKIREYLELEKGDHVIFRFSDNKKIVMEKAVISSTSEINKKKK